MKALVKRFLKDEQGLELSEYAIMAGLIILIAVVTIGLVGGHINNIFINLSGQLATAEAAS